MARSGRTRGGQDYTRTAGRQQAELKRRRDGEQTLDAEAWRDEGRRLNGRELTLDEWRRMEYIRQREQGQT